jgi:serine/threonine-protein kinase
VLVSRQGVAKLSDFGMAGKKPRSAEGRIVGTPAFLSPEHVAGAPGTMRSDLFSFGSLLYYLAAGEPLFDPGPGNIRVTQAIREIEAARARPPEKRLRRLPGPLAKAVRIALRSDDPEALLRELREALKKTAADERPEAVLRRELGLEGDPAPGAAGDDPADGSGLRDRYLRLREDGKHREAVALLEKALRRQPDNPLLRELLAAPPAKPKTGTGAGAVTVDVGAAPAATGKAAVPRRTLPLAAAGLGILAVTLGLLAWGRMGGERRQDGPGVPSASAGGNGVKAAPISLDGKAPMAPVPEARPRIHRQASPAGGIRPAARPGAGVTSDVPAYAARLPRPPAVSLAGPAGTKVAMDDTAEWTSPGPASGWPVSPGLVNITLTPPDGRRPISSSLFLSADTLYVLSLDGEGGFSVARRRR